MKKSVNIIRQGMILATLSFAILAIAHGGDHHKKMNPTQEEKTSFEKINDRYLRDIKPIFEKKCFDCHSSQTKMPWYSKIPGVRQLIAHDISEAKEHLDMQSNFPFSGHADPLEDLSAIDESVQAEEMPPFLYRIMHSSSRLNKEEKKLIHDWVQYGKMH